MQFRRGSVSSWESVHAGGAHKEVLTEAVTVGNATARAIALGNRDPRAFVYKYSQWKRGFIVSVS